MQRAEVGDAVDPEQHRLAVNHELPVPVLARRRSGKDFCPAVIKVTPVRDGSCNNFGHRRL